MIIDMENGTKKTISFTECRSTGYIWDFEKDQDIVNLEIKKIIPDNIGVGGSYILEVTFHAKNIGSIEFKNSRPWDEEIQETAVVTVI